MIFSASVSRPSTSFVLLTSSDQWSKRGSDKNAANFLSISIIKDLLLFYETVHHNNLAQFSVLCNEYIRSFRSNLSRTDLIHLMHFCKLIKLKWFKYCVDVYGNTILVILYDIYLFSHDKEYNRKRFCKLLGLGCLRYSLFQLKI